MEITKEQLARWLVGGLMLIASVPAYADLKALEEAARKEGELTWYTSYYTTETAQEVGAAFSKKYPGIKVNAIRTTIGVAWERLNMDLKGQRAIADVFSTTEIGHHVNLKQRGLLAKYKAENGPKVSPEFGKLHDPDGHWYLTGASVVYMAYNKNKVKAADAPKRWSDLADPKWKGQLAISDPAFSSVSAIWVYQMSKLYGWEFLEKVAKNRPQIGRSMYDTVTLLNSGERSVAAQAVNAEESAAKGNPLVAVYPEEGALLFTWTTGVMANARHPNAARLFIEFLLDVENAQIATNRWLGSIRPEVKARPEAKPLSEIKTIRPTDEEIIKEVPKVTEKWREIF
jgi:iron(III) transport system substrate-binding protein